MLFCNAEAGSGLAMAALMMCLCTKGMGTVYIGALYGLY
jgi:hypothetical protein